MHGPIANAVDRKSSGAIGVIRRLDECAVAIILILRPGHIREVLKKGSVILAPGPPLQKPDVRRQKRAIRQICPPSAAAIT